MMLHKDVDHDSQCGGQVADGHKLFGTDYWCVYCGAKFDGKYRTVNTEDAYKQLGRMEGKLIMRGIIIAIAALAIGGNVTTASAMTEDSPGWQCARDGNRFCGGLNAPVRFAGKLVLVRGFATPRHALMLYHGRRFLVGRFATDCKPSHPYVIRVRVGDTTFADVHACKHTYSVAVS